MVDMLAIADNVMLGSSEVTEVRNSEGIFYSRLADSLDGRAIIPGYSGNIPVEDNLEYSTSEPESQIDWTGVGFYYTGSGNTRATTVCCTLVGPADETHFACSDDDHARPAPGDFIGFLGNQNNELEREVAAVHKATDLGDSNYGSALIEFTQPVKSGDPDYCKIYSVLENPGVIDNRPVVLVEQDRTICTRTAQPYLWTVSTYSPYANHAERHAGSFLYLGDSGKPGFYLDGTEPLIWYGGAYSPSSSSLFRHCFDELNDVMFAEKVYRMTTVTVV